MTNQSLLNQPIGASLKGWKTAISPPKIDLNGKYCHLEPLKLERHSKSLFEKFLQDPPSLWTYLPYGPFENHDAFYACLKEISETPNLLLYSIFTTQSDAPCGVASYLDIHPDIGTIEVGHVHFSESLKNTTAATESMYLMMRHAFENLGYRRYVWRCDALNENSRKAATRLGFQLEGIFRQHTIYKERNRDTAWLSIVDHEWPKLKKKFEKWLDSTNFDANGNQKHKLKDFS